ncbi:MAG: hypothetical protein ACK4FB_07865 [Brevundimonas sp.]|uniref:hypothetical protein n=1 Tax=Brevundimonas sp. TaxID=1871086 RepID=UPI0039189402
MPEQGDECNIGDLQKLHKSLDMRNSKVCNSLHTVYGDKPMTFQLDTSGVVYVQSAFITDRNSKVAKRWSDLSPFTQGYIEALFAAFDPEPTPGVRLAPGPFGFSDLAPETLARIIADCGLAQREGDGRMEGIDYWNRRQAGEYLTTRQPQTVQLGDDGKVRLANV